MTRDETINEPMSPFEDWWESTGAKMKNEPGENINDTELPLRIAKEAWEAGLKSRKQLITNPLGTVSWGELIELIDLEIKRRERLDVAQGGD